MRMREKPFENEGLKSYKNNLYFSEFSNFKEYKKVTKNLSPKKDPKGLYPFLVQIFNSEEDTFWLLHNLKISWLTSEIL